MGEFAIDHFQPMAIHPDCATDYDNLFYVCGPCNLRKTDEIVLDPLLAMTAEAVGVHPDGTIEARTPDSLRIVDLLQLDLDSLTEFRSLWIDVIKLAAANDPELYRRLLAYPADLPDLSSLRPPGGNSRPEGIAKSYFKRQQRGELSTTY